MVIFDGIDECSDSEGFVESLLQICNKTPEVRLLLFSRINVPGLKLSVSKSMAFTMPKSRVTEDISSFRLGQLDDMFEREVLSRGGGTEVNLARRASAGAVQSTKVLVLPAAPMCLPPAAQMEMTALRDVEEPRSWSLAEAETTWSECRGRYNQFTKERDYILRMLCIVMSRMKNLRGSHDYLASSMRLVIQ
ncbi:hypothetical protein J7T55_000401 [Diaporthe amygdali]|uniref:uncharacterized protein n=1 Tax=Phomopsis amygdali TaxID=1214568 RepID=UPI0022FE85E1|nr:uncharacterized protein J7T55_000401 [Diaporthe amygdali]KAJ0109476.1 hypothetical protein J7T55_000401 [Diaporthe amygdali]